jgi:hypothetical protein
VVLSVDERSQIRALDHPQPSLPLSFDITERGSHDYVRHGTTTLFASLGLATGEVIGELHRRHRGGEFLQFLCTIDESVPRSRSGRRTDPKAILLYACENLVHH